MFGTLFMVSCLLAKAPESRPVQVPNWVVAQADSVAPVWLVGKERNVAGSAQLGGNIDGVAHVAAGAQALYFPSELSATLFSGIAAGVGELKATSSHLSFSMGVPTYEFGARQERPFSVLTLTGNLRLIEHVTLKSEHWVFVSPETQEAPPSQHSVSVRVHQAQIALAAGMLLPQHSRLPLPWLSASYHF